MEIHSRKASRSEILKSLETSLRFSGAPQSDLGLSSKLARYRDQLNQWSSAIHKPIGQSGRSPFDVVGCQVKLRANGAPLIDARLHDAAEWSSTKLSAVEDAVKRATEAVLRLNAVPQNHPWFGTAIDLQSPFDLDRLVRKLNVAAEIFSALSGDIRKVFALIAEKREPSMADAGETVGAFRHLVTVPIRHRAALANPVWINELSTIESAIDEAERLASFIAEANRHFREKAWTANAAMLLLTLRTDGPSFVRRFSRRYRDATAEFARFATVDRRKTWEAALLSLNSF